MLVSGDNIPRKPVMTVPVERAINVEVFMAMCVCVELREKT